MENIVLSRKAARVKLPIMPHEWPRSRSLFSAPALLWASELKYYYSAVIKLQHVKFKSLASPSENTKDCIHTKHPNIRCITKTSFGFSTVGEKRFMSPSPPSYLLYSLLPSLQHLVIVLLHVWHLCHQWKWISSCSIKRQRAFALTLVVKMIVNVRRRSKFIRVVDERRSVSEKRRPRSESRSPQRESRHWMFFWTLPDILCVCVPELNQSIDTDTHTDSKPSREFIHHDTATTKIQNVTGNTWKIEKYVTSQTNQEEIKQMK